MKTFSEAFITKNNIKNISSKKVSISDIDFNNDIATKKGCKDFTEILKSNDLWPGDINNGNIWKCKAFDGLDIKWYVWTDQEAERNAVSRHYGSYYLMFTITGNNRAPVTNSLLILHKDYITASTRTGEDSLDWSPEANDDTKKYLKDYITDIADLFDFEYVEFNDEYRKEFRTDGIWVDPKSSIYDVVTKQ